MKWENQWLPWYLVYPVLLRDHLVLLVPRDEKNILLLILHVSFVLLWMSEWLKSLSCVWLFATPWTVAHQAPPSIGVSRQEFWSWLPFLSPGDPPDPGIEPRSPALQADTLTFVLLCIYTNGDIALNSWQTPFPCFWARNTVKNTAGYMGELICIGESGHCFQDLMQNCKSDNQKNSWLSCWGRRL